jgi:hypothetical protein
MPSFRFFNLVCTFKQCILGQLCTTALLCFTQKPYTLVGFEPVSSVPEGDAMSTAPRRQGHLLNFNQNCKRIVVNLFKNMSSPLHRYKPWPLQGRNVHSFFDHNSINRKKQFYAKGLNFTLRYKILGYKVSFPGIKFIPHRHYFKKRENSFQLLNFLIPRYTISYPGTRFSYHGTEFHT